MKTDTELSETLDPRQYLPVQEDFNCNISPTVFQFADEILAESHPKMGFDGFRRSALAGAALYVAIVAVTGPIVKQETVSVATGTTPMSIRSHMPDMASVALTEVDLSEYDAIVARRLQHLADGGNIPTLPE